MIDDLTTVTVDQYYPHPPSKVWHALTTPDLMAQWLLKPVGFQPRVGQQFTLQARPMTATSFSGTILCEVLEATEPERLAISWDDPLADQPTGWIISWDLHPEGHGTRILLTHSGFDPDSPTQQLSRTIMGNGWPRITRDLAEVLTTLDEAGA